MTIMISSLVEYIVWLEIVLGREKEISMGESWDLYILTMMYVVSEKRNENVWGCQQESKRKRMCLQKKKNVYTQNLSWQCATKEK